MALVTQLGQGTPFSATAAGTSAGATATKAASGAGTNHFVTHISGHTDTDSLIQILDGSTVVWESKIDISLEGTSFGFDVGNVVISSNAAAGAKIASSTTDCQVNISGYTIP